MHHSLFFVAVLATILIPRLSNAQFDDEEFSDYFFIPESLDFGDVPVGGSVKLTLDIDYREGIGTPDEIISVTYPEGFSGPNLAGTTGSLPVEITFDPIEGRNYSGAIEFETTTFGGFYTVPVSGTGMGVAPPTRVIALSGDLIFGTQQVGSSFTRELTIQNSGNAPLAVSGVQLPTGFAAGWTSGSIASGGLQTVVVTFTPTAAISYAGQVVITSDKTSGANSLAVSGTGEAAPGTADIGVLLGRGESSPPAGATIDFGTAAVGNPVVFYFTFVNRGAEAVQVDRLRLPSGYSLVSFSGGEIAPLGVFQAGIRLDADAAGTFAGACELVKGFNCSHCAEEEEVLATFQIAGQVVATPVAENGRRFEAGFGVTGFGKTVDIHGGLAAIGGAGPTNVSPVDITTHFDWPQALGDDVKEVLTTADGQLVLGRPDASGGNLVIMANPLDGADVIYSSPEYPAAERVGASVAGAGSRFFVGAPGANRVLVATRVDEVGREYAITPFANRPGGDTGQFGEALAANGNTILVGSPPAGGGAGGVAYIFDTDGTLIHTLLRPAGTAWRDFGRSVVLNGTYCAVGAPGSRTVSIFAVESGELVETIAHPEGGAGANFGWDVAMDGETLVIGAPGGANRDAAGAAYLYNIEGARWFATLQAPAGVANAGWGFGSSVGIGAGNVLVGSPHEGALEGGTPVGGAYLFNVGEVVMPSGGMIVASIDSEEVSIRKPLDFGTATADGPTTLGVVIKNPTDEEMTIDDIEVEGEFALMLSEDSGTRRIPPKGETELYFDFGSSSTTPGKHEGQVKVSYTSGVSKGNLGFGLLGNYPVDFTGQLISVRYNGRNSEPPAFDKDGRKLMSVMEAAATMWSEALGTYSYPNGEPVTIYVDVQWRPKGDFKALNLLAQANTKDIIVNGRGEPIQWNGDMSFNSAPLRTITFADPDKPDEFVPLIHFFDPTPYENEEFAIASEFAGKVSNHSRFFGGDGDLLDRLEVGFAGDFVESVAGIDNRIDVLSAALHELGHVLGIATWSLSKELADGSVTLDPQMVGNHQNIKVILNADKAHTLYTNFVMESGSATESKDRTLLSAADVLLAAKVMWIINGPARTKWVNLHRTELLSGDWNSGKWIGGRRPVWWADAYITARSSWVKHRVTRPFRLSNLGQKAHTNVVNNIFIRDGSSFDVRSFKPADFLFWKKENLPNNFRTLEVRDTVHVDESSKILVTGRPGMWASTVNAEGDIVMNGGSLSCGVLNAGTISGFGAIEVHKRYGSIGTIKPQSASAIGIAGWASERMKATEWKLDATSGGIIMGADLSPPTDFQSCQFDVGANGGIHLNSSGHVNGSNSGTIKDSHIKLNGSSRGDAWFTGGVLLADVSINNSRMDVRGSAQMSKGFSLVDTETTFADGGSLTLSDSVKIGSGATFRGNGTIQVGGETNFQGAPSFLHDADVGVDVRIRPGGQLTIGADFNRYPHLKTEAHVKLKSLSVDGTSAAPSTLLFSVAPPETHDMITVSESFELGDLQVNVGILGQALSGATWKLVDGKLEGSGQFVRLSVNDPGNDPGIEGYGLYTAGGEDLYLAKGTPSTPGLTPIGEYLRLYSNQMSRLGGRVFNVATSESAFLPNRDADRDGATNEEEIDAGTNPFDQPDGGRFEISEVALTNDSSRIEVTWPMERGDYYWVERSSEMVAGSWEEISGSRQVAESDSGALVIELPNEAKGKTGYYRVVRVDADDARVLADITTQPEDTAVVPGQRVEFSIVADGADLAYQWQKDGEDLEGETGASFTIASAQTGDAGSYTVVVSNRGIPIASNAATLTLTVEAAK